MARKSKSPRKRRERDYPPLIPELMLPVTKSNKSRIEKELGCELPDDVRYVILPASLQTDEFWWLAEPKIRQQKKENYSDIWDEDWA